MDTQRLIEFGTFLDGVDNVREKNDAGFNRLDKRTWPGARTSGRAEVMARVLHKYGRQLRANYGDEAVDSAFSGFDITAAPQIVPALDMERKRIVFELRGFLGRDKFSTYVAAQKAAGLWFDGVSKLWYLALSRADQFDGAQYAEAMLAQGFEVEDIPEAPAAKPLTAAETFADLTSTYPSIRSGAVAVVRKTDGRIAFAFPFNQALVDLFSSRKGNVSGIFEFNPAGKSWETFQVELAEEALAKLPARMPTGWNLLVDESYELAKLERQAEVEAFQSAIPEVASELAEDISLFAYQNEAVRFFERTDGNALLGDEMGLGKTLQCLAYAVAQKRRLVVVAPKVVRRTWVLEARKFFPAYFPEDRTLEMTTAKLRKGQIPDLHGFTLVSVNFESVEKFIPLIQAGGFDLLVIDESHRIKSGKAKVTQTVTALAQGIPHRILLSGTAIKNKKEELFTQLNLVKPGMFKNKEELRSATIGGTWNKIREVYLARTKKEVLTFLPEKLVQQVELDVSDCPDKPARLDIGDISKLKADIAIAKVPATVEFVEELLDSSDSKVLVFTDSKEAAEQIAEKLGTPALLHHGQMGDEAREKVKADFQNGTSPARVLVTTRQSLAVGATLTAADKVVFNDLPWTPADVRQAEDRAHRAGQKSVVNVYWIVAAANKWDKALIGIIRRKYELAKKLCEGKQMTAEEREWLEKKVSVEEVLAVIEGKTPEAPAKAEAPAA